MLNKIIDFSIRNKLIIGLFIIALIGYGGYEFTRLPIDAVPDITNNQVQVITVAPSLGAADIERLITYPVEQVNNNIAGLKEIRSFSRFGLSLVTIVFEDDIDIYWARQQVTERIQQVQDEIPQGIAEVSLAPVTTGLGEIYQYVVKAKENYKDRYSPMELRTIQDWIVRRQLLGVKGVAEVSSFGGHLKQYEVAVTPDKLNSYGITIEDIFHSLENNNQNTGGAYIERHSTVLYIRSEGLIGKISDIENITIKTLGNGIPLMIKDVATVGYGSATRYGALCYNDEGEVSGAVVMMLKGANSSEVIRNVKERVDQIRKTLPEGVEIEPFLDRTKMVSNAIDTVKINLIEGALIVLVVLVIFLGNIRAGLLIASVIPLAMLFAVILMNRFGVIGNLMSLGALDFGLIVDGSVFIVEAALHQIVSNRFTPGGKLTQTVANLKISESTKKIARSVVFGQLIILIVYLPTFTLQGIEGKMFIPMAQTVSFALLGAFILSLTYVPMMSALLFRKIPRNKRNFSDRMMLFLEKRYQRLLSKVLERKKAVIISSVVLFAVSIGVLMNMGGEFIPTLEEGDFAVETRVLTGSSLETSIESTKRAAAILKERFPEVTKVVTKIGSSEIPTDPMPMDAADMIVNLHPKSEWTSAKTFDELAEKMSKELEEVPGITVSFQYPVQMRFNELMTGAKQDVVCKLFGENIDTLAKYSRLLGKIAETVDGTIEHYVEPLKGVPQLVIEYDRAALAQFGLNITTVNDIVNASLAGQKAGTVYEGEKRFDMVVRLSGEKRRNIEDVRNILIMTPTGIQVPLLQIASVELKDTPNQIQREDARRRVIVGFNSGSRDVQSIVNELQQKVEKDLRLPAGYHITYGGAFENLNAAKARLSIAVPISLLLIFLLLYFSFNSIRQGLLIYSAIPLSAIGGILALNFRGMPFSISAGVGFIALFGVAVLNGIVLIAEFNRLKNSGMNDLRKIVLTGTRIRLRPVLITGLVASLGFLPMALSNGSGAEVQRPLATVVIGGLLIATALTLFVLPVLYILTERRKTIPPAKFVVPILVFLAATPDAGKAQNRIALKAALDSALTNNYSLKHEQLITDAQKQMVRSGYDIPYTSVTGEYGQINSALTDNKINISQGFQFPLVYARQKKVYQETWKEGLLRIDVKQAEIIKEVSELYFTIQTLLKKQELLRRADSLYGEYLKKAALRYRTGETDRLEQSTAESQKAQAQIQLSELTTGISILMEQFRFIMNTREQYWPFPDETPAIKLSAEPALINHPLVKLAEQQKQLSAATLSLGKAQLYPGLSLGYNNMSIQGMGADNVEYKRSDRFQSIQAGVEIPLLPFAASSRIRSSRLLYDAGKLNYEMQVKKLSADYKNALASYLLHKAAIEQYDKTILKSVRSIYSTANLRFTSGEISFIEWMVLVNQAIGAEAEYLEQLMKLNNSIILLNYYSGNTN